MNVHSIQTRFYAAFLIVAVITAFVSIYTTTSAKNNLAEAVIEKNLWQSSENYFDAINTLMISGLMNNRKILQDKLMSHEEITSARIIRAEGITSIFGPGFEDQGVQDEFDQRALTGEEFSLLEETENGREMTVFMPLLAWEDYAGTNCLSCHANVEKDAVLGAVRITASLKSVDENIAHSVTTSAIWQLSILGAGFLLLLFFIRHSVINGLTQLADNLKLLTENLDFTGNYRLSRKDEIGQVYASLQSLVETVHASLVTVVESSKDVLNVSQEVHSGADKTEHAVSEQKLATDSVATAVNEMDVTASEVRERTKVASEKSNTASQLTQESIQLSDKTQKGLETLMTDVNDSANVIHRLDEKTQSVNGILEVISNIAEQTNLLALNAAIEAARAGEQGRGFAVVADEVRTLANRTHESTAEIQATLNALQEEAKNAVTSMQRSSDQTEKQSEDVRNLVAKLKDVATHVAEMNELNAQIALATDQQNETAQYINRDTANIRDIADHSEEVALESKSHSKELVRLAEQLSESIKKFRI